MGIGGSKPSAAETPKLTCQRRPLFGLRWRRRIIKTLSNISTQELLVTESSSLRDYVSSPSHSLVDPLDRSLSTPAVVATAEAVQAFSREEIRDEAPTSKTEEMEEESAVSRNDNEGDGDQIISKGDPLRASCGDEKEMMPSDHNVDGHEKEGEEKEEEEEDEGGWVVGFGDLTASPSFREYCRFSFPDTDNISENEQCSFVDAETSISEESIGSSASSTTSSAKATHRTVKERFRRLRILTRGPIAISNLLSLRSCYYNHTSRANDESQLLSVKSS